MRTRTVNDYQTILNGVREYISAHRHHLDDITLDTYLKDSPWSRRSIQRALSHHHTGWRKLLSEERSRHGN